jgi:exosortase A-associated hydrolase 2
LQIDLLGCGDSSGDFGDAGWQAWLDDLDAGADWLTTNTNTNTNASASASASATATASNPLWLWGHRVGCLLAVELAQRRDEACNFLFWQPPASGKLLLQQFLRLKVAGDLLGGKAAGAMATLKQQLLAGESVEVAGYALSPALANSLEQAALEPPRNSAQAIWLELSAQPAAAVSPVISTLAQQWAAAGTVVDAQQIQGPLFWQTSEIEDAPALLLATLNCLRAARA